VRPIGSLPRDDARRSDRLGRQADGLALRPDEGLPAQEPSGPLGPVRRAVPGFAEGALKAKAALYPPSTIKKGRRETGPSRGTPNEGAPQEASPDVHHLARRGEEKPKEPRHAVRCSFNSNHRDEQLDATRLWLAAG
jgi:hypothetical protein